MRVCYFGTYRANYARNHIMKAGLRSAGVEVIECHVPLWTGIEDRVQVASGQWASWSFFKRVISTYSRLLAQYRALPKTYDVLILGYPGQLDVFLAWLLTKHDKKPLVLDMLMSIYLVALERELVKAYPITGWLIKHLEKLGSQLPDLLIFNTNAYIDWFRDTYNFRSKKVALVTMGVDDENFCLTEAVSKNTQTCKVLYYGTFIQNHGVPCIIEAAKLLKSHSAISFELIGDGPTRALAETLTKRYNLPNVTFSGWVEKAHLPAKIVEADIILGVFSTTAQSQMTIHNKIYEGLAMKKPVITGDSPTIREVFDHNKHLVLVERDNPQALAEALITLEASPTLRIRLGQTGYDKVQREFTVTALGKRFRAVLESLLNQNISQ